MDAAQLASRAALQVLTVVGDVLGDLRWTVGQATGGN